MSGKVAGGWPVRLRIATSKYNKTYHSTIKMRPIDVSVDNAGALASRFLNLNQSELFRNSMKDLLKLGDLVRIKDQARERFAKANHPRNSEEIYSISRIHLHPTGFKYKLSTTDLGNQILAGSYYNFELIKLRRPQQ